MKHASSQNLYRHWDERRDQRALPERGDIDPSGIRSALPDTFILSYENTRGHPIRLAGTRMCALFGAELKDRPFLPLWRSRDQAAIARLIQTSVDDSIGVVAAVTGHCHDRPDIELELLVLPLSHCGQTHLRMIGSLSPLTPPAWLGAGLIDGLTLGDYRYLGYGVGPVPRWVPPDSPSGESPRVRSGLFVYDGGRS